MRRLVRGLPEAMLVLMISFLVAVVVVGAIALVGPYWTVGTLVVVAYLAIAWQAG